MVSAQADEGHALGADGRLGQVGDLLDQQLPDAAAACPGHPEVALAPHESPGRARWRRRSGWSRRRRMSMVRPATWTTPWWSPTVMLPLASTKLLLLIGSPARARHAAHVDHEEHLEDDQTADGADAQGAVEQQQPDADHGDDAQAGHALGAHGRRRTLLSGPPRCAAWPRRHRGSGGSTTARPRPMTRPSATHGAESRSDDEHGDDTDDERGDHGAPQHLGQGVAAEVGEALEHVHAPAPPRGRCGSA